MEVEAHNRDQTAWACSAQNAKMLPKKQGPSQNKAVAAEMKRRVNSEFEKFEKDDYPPPPPGHIIIGKQDG